MLHVKREIWSSGKLWQGSLMGGVILKIVRKWTDTTTNSQYCHAAIRALVVL